MPMQPQSAQPIPSATQATQGALQQAQNAPAAQQQGGQASGQQPGPNDQSSQQLMQNLEQHLNQLNPQQQQFLASSLQHYANIVIPVLGIVCGPEVFQYFVNVYKTHFAKSLNKQAPQQQQPNSAPAPQQGQQPNPVQAPQQQPQAAPAQAPAGQPQP